MSMGLDEVLRYLRDSKSNYVIVDAESGESSVKWSNTNQPVVFGDFAEACMNSLTSDKVITEYQYIRNETD